MIYKVRFQQSEEGYSVYCPGLPGCWSQGETEEEALANIRDAISEYLAAFENRCSLISTPLHPASQP